MKGENGSRCDLCTTLLKDTAPGLVTIVSISVLTDFLDEDGLGIPGVAPLEGAATIKFCTRCTELIGAGALKPSDAVAQFIASARQQLSAASS